MKRLSEFHQYDKVLLITSDQATHYEEIVREKPESRTEALNFLSSYSEKSLTTLSAVVVTEYPSGFQKSATDIAVVHFSTITKDTAEKIVNKGEIYSVAGGIRIEDDDLGPLISRIEGTVDSVMGLPVELTQCLVEEVRMNTSITNCGSFKYGGYTTIWRPCTFLQL